MAVRASKDLVLGLCVNADTYEEAAAEAATAGPPTSGGAEGGGEPAPADAPAEGGADEEPPQLHRPFDVSVLGRYDFRLRPTNFVPGFKRLRASAILDYDEVSGWYHGSNLLRGMHRLPYVAARLRCTPNDPPPPTEPVVALPVEPLDDDEALRAVRDKSGVNLRPLRVEADGSCLVHALSTALTGSQVYFDALRWAAHRELRDHRAFYERAGLVTGADKARLLPRLEAAAEAAKALGLVDRERGMREAAEEVRRFGAPGGPTANARPKWTATTVEEAVEKARPSEGEARGPSHYLEEIHVAALANVLKRPIVVLAEQFQGGLFLPLRHDPEDCRYLVEGEWRANPPLFLYLQFDHYLPLCPQDGTTFWAWAEGPEGFAGDEGALSALRMYEAARGGREHRVPEWVEEICLYIVMEAASRMEGVLQSYELPEADREEYRRKFGHPAQMAELPLSVIFEETPVKCSKPLKRTKETNAVFRALGWRVEGEDGGEVLEGEEEGKQGEEGEWDGDGEEEEEPPYMSLYDSYPDSQSSYYPPLSPSIPPPPPLPPLTVTAAGARLHQQQQRRGQRRQRHQSLQDLGLIDTVVQVSVHIHKIDYARLQRTVFALYYLMSSGHHSHSSNPNPVPNALPKKKTKRARGTGAGMEGIPSSSSFFPLAPPGPPAPRAPLFHGDEEEEEDGLSMIDSDGAEAGDDEESTQEEEGEEDGGVGVVALPPLPPPSLPAPPLTMGLAPAAAAQLAEQEEGAVAAPAAADAVSSNQPVSVPVPRGVLPCAGDADQGVWKFVLNLTQNDTLNLGVARLYCDPEGWDLRPLTSAQRDPRVFLQGELQRLEGRFQALTGMDLGHMTISSTALDPPTLLPKALLALQTVMRCRPYPGRLGLLHPSHILIADPPQPLLALATHPPPAPPAAAATAAAGDGGDGMDFANAPPAPSASSSSTGGGTGSSGVSLAALRLPTAHERRLLLAALLRRGLPQNLSFFEQAALATLLPERCAEPRARFAFAGWVAQAAETTTTTAATAGSGDGDGGGGGLTVERGEAPPHAIRRVVLRAPCGGLKPLPRLASLFPPSFADGEEDDGTAGRQQQQPMASATSSSRNSSSSSSSSSASTSSTATAPSLLRPRSPSPSEGDDHPIASTAAAAVPMAVVGEARLHSVANGARPAAQTKGRMEEEEGKDDACGRSPCSKRLAASWPLAAYASDGGGGGGGVGGRGGGGSGGPTAGSVQCGASNPL